MVEEGEESTNIFVVILTAKNLRALNRRFCRSEINNCACSTLTSLESRILGVRGHDSLLDFAVIVPKY